MRYEDQREDEPDRQTCYSLHAAYKPKYDSVSGLSEGKRRGDRRPIHTSTCTVDVKECIEFSTDSASINSDAMF